MLTISSLKHIQTFPGLKDRIKFEEKIDYESKLKALTWESGRSLTRQGFLKSYDVPHNLTRHFVNTIPFNSDNQDSKIILYEYIGQQPNEVIIIHILGVKMSC